MLLNALAVVGMAASANAVKLFVSSYTPDSAEVALGAVETLEFTPGLGDGPDAAAATLKKIAKNQDCKSAPTWLDFSLGADKILCVDEGFATPNSTLVNLDVQSDGNLKNTSTSDTLTGPVFSKFYNNNTALALPHFAPPGVISTFKVSDEGYETMQVFTFENATTGPKPDQDGSHVHQAVLDPTNQYMVFPDLGSDVVRVFCIDPETGHLSEHESLQSKAGYGPRHATFWSSDNQNTNGTIFLFVIHELENKIVSYQVGYKESGGLTFQEVDEVSTYGNETTPAGAKASEIDISPDNKFVVASNRNATIFNVPNPNGNGTKIASDSMVTFKPSEDGKLHFVQLTASGGLFPRHFSMNKDGSLIAIANQQSQTVHIFSRCLESGTIGALVATASELGPGQLTSVHWEDEATE